MKTVNINNLLQPDPRIKHFRRISKNGDSDMLTADHWLQDIYSAKLKDFVPSEIKELVDAAQGAMVYGYFYYPLLALASEQLFRIGETAIKIKCKQLEVPNDIRYHKEKIKWLLEQGVDMDQSRWDALWDLRNPTAHPSAQQLLDAGTGISVLHLIISDINRLFGAATAATDRN